MRRDWKYAVSAVAVTLVLALTFGSCGQTADYPTRPITLIVPWGAGGGTDAVARILGSLIERELGKPVNVVNRTGGSGVVGHQAIATAAPDGYTIGLITVEIAMLHHQGLTDLTGASLAPLGLVNYDAAAIQVRADAPFATLPDLLAAIKARPNTFKASGTAQGGIWHVALAGLLNEQQIPPASVAWVPSASNAAGLLDLVAGGVDIVPGSHPEGRSLIDAGKVKSLAVLDDQPTSLYPQVPTSAAVMGSRWKMGVWRGMAAPKNLPPAIQSRLEVAVKKAYDSPEYQEFSTSRGFTRRWLGPSEFGAFMAESDTEMGAVMKAVGLAK